MKKLFLALILFGAQTAHANLNDFCEHLGGRVIYDRPSSMHMLCRIGASAIGLSTFFYQVDEKLALQAIKLFCSRTTLPPFGDSYTPLMPNPASEYCQSVGGTAIPTTSLKDHDIGICHFNDGSDIEQWTLYRGVSHSKNAQMSALLKCGSN